LCEIPAGERGQGTEAECDRSVTCVTHGGDEPGGAENKPFPSGSIKRTAAVYRWRSTLDLWMGADRNMTKPDKKSREGHDNLHGNAADRCPVALLLIDVLNDLDFPQNEELVQKSASLGQCIANLKRRCKQAGIPALYINDNHGKWRSDYSAVLQHCLRPDAPGRHMVEQLVPGPEDYIILKPKHSAFYATPLETLLEYIGVRAVVVAGVTTNACVMITASDLYVRDFRLFVPSDCVAGLTERDQQQALEMMEKNFAADRTPSEELDLSNLLTG
jgi:nicotinamidase-related amidase